MAVLRAGGVPSLLRLASCGSTRLALVASACLRFLSLSPGFMPIAASQGESSLHRMMGRTLMGTPISVAPSLLSVCWVTH